MSGTSGFADINALLSNLGLSITDESLLAQLPPGLGAFGDRSATIAAAGSNQIALTGIAPDSGVGNDFTVLVNGSNMSLGGGLSGTATLSDVLASASGTVGSIEVFSGGSFGNGTVTGGTDVLNFNFVSASEMTLVTPGVELVVNGSNLPTTLQSIASIAENTYSGPAIGLSSVEIENPANNQVEASLVLTSTSVTITEDGLTIAATGSYATSITPNSTAGDQISTSTTGLTISAGGQTIFTATGTTAASALRTAEEMLLDATTMNETKFDLLGEGIAALLFRTPGANGQTSLAAWYDVPYSEGGTPYDSALGSLPQGFSLVRQGFFDGSGAANLVLANAVSGQIDIMGGANVDFSTFDAPTTFASTSTIGTVPLGTWVAASGDFFGDGVSAILFRNTVNNQVSLWETNGTSLLGSQTIGTAPQGWVVAGTGDFYGNGHDDILWLDEATGQLAIWEMNGSTPIAESVLADTVPLGWKVEGQAIGDYFSNEEDGVVFRNLDTGQVALWQMDGASVVSATVLSQSMSSVWRLAEVSDFFGTGTDDMVWQNTDTGDIELWQMQGTTIVQTMDFAGPEADSNIAGLPGSPEIVGNELYANYGLFADGTSAVLWQNSTTGQVALWQMSAGSPVTSEELVIGGAVPFGWQAVGVGPFYAYGGEAILWENSSTNQLALWGVNGGTVVSESTFAQAPSGWLVVGLGDFYGTGLDSILWRNPSTGQTAVWEMDGQSVVSTATFGGTVSSLWQVAGVADFNGDGRADILWENSGTNQVAVWEINGSSILAQTIIAQAPSGWQIAGVGNFDGGTTSEILWENQGAGELAVWQTNGTALTGSDVIATGVPFQQGWQIAAIGEYTGSTLDEILWQNTETGQVAVWQVSLSGATSAGIVAGGVPSGWLVAANPVLRAPPPL